MSRPSVHCNTELREKRRRGGVVEGVEALAVEEQVVLAHCVGSDGGVWNEDGGGVWEKGWWGCVERKLAVLCGGRFCQV